MRENEKSEAEAIQSVSAHFFNLQLGRFASACMRGGLMQEVSKQSAFANCVQGSFVSVLRF